MVTKIELDEYNPLLTKYWNGIWYDNIRKNAINVPALHDYVRAWFISNCTGKIWFSVGSRYRDEEGSYPTVGILTFQKDEVPLILN